MEKNRKKTKQCGQEYVVTSGKIVKGKKCIYMNCSDCSRNCIINFSHAFCELLFDTFWKMGDIHIQRL